MPTLVVHIKLKWVCATKKSIINTQLSIMFQILYLRWPITISQYRYTSKLQAKRKRNTVQRPNSIRTLTDHRYYKQQVSLSCRRLKETKSSFGKLITLSSLEILSLTKIHCKDDFHCERREEPKGKQKRV